MRYNFPSGLQLRLLLAIVVIFLLLVANFQSVRVAKDAGKVGLWARADSAPYFDDLRVIARLFIQINDHFRRRKHEETFKT
jgi:hypothetical protein